uniref:Pirin C-terminal domain-containing protein n=1 Tax=Mola mola TaxID=94237 RepID=A0A3Q4BST0_MOLML
TTAMRVEKRVLSVEQSEGVGARVGRSIRIFISCYLCMSFLKRVTYVSERCLAHEDFCAFVSFVFAMFEICPSIYQWMTEPVAGLQLWVNLSRRDKMVEPQYQYQGGVTAAVISGEALGAKVFLMLFNYKRVHFSYLTGPDEEQKKVEPHHTVVVGDGDCVRVEKKGSEASHFVLIAGEPIKEPVVQHGTSFSDRNGFGRAIHWRSKIRDSF